MEAQSFRGLPLGTCQAPRVRYTPSQGREDSAGEVTKRTCIRLSGTLIPFHPRSFTPSLLAPLPFRGPAHVHLGGRGQTGANPLAPRGALQFLFCAVREGE